MLVARRHQGYRRVSELTDGRGSQPRSSRGHDCRSGGGELTRVRALGNAGIVCDDFPGASLLLLIPPEEPAGAHLQYCKAAALDLVRRPLLFHGGEDCQAERSARSLIG